LVIIAAYGTLDDQECKTFQPKLVFVDDNNVIAEQRGHIPTQQM